MPASGVAAFGIAGHLATQAIAVRRSRRRNGSTRRSTGFRACTWGSASRRTRSDEGHLAKLPTKAIAACRSREPEVAAHRPARVQSWHRQENPETVRQPLGQPQGRRWRPTSPRRRRREGRARGRRQRCRRRGQLLRTRRVNTFQPSWARQAIQVSTWWTDRDADGEGERQGVSQPEPSAVPERRHRQSAGDRWRPAETRPRPSFAAWEPSRSGLFPNRPTASTTRLITQPSGR
jgi:hypothetical protein